MKIVTDSGADLTREDREELGVVVAPLFIQFPNGEVNAEEISRDEFYDRLEAMRPAIPTTAQPSSGQFAQFYRDFAATDRDILSIHISSGLSGTINSASVGAEQASDVANVTVWDTMTLAGGERFQVLAAARAARAGWPLAEIQHRLEQIRQQTEVIFTLETLEYLAAGGRIGRVQALAGSLLHIKPVIHVDHKDGKYSNTGRGRSIPKAITAIVHHLQSLYGSKPLFIISQHGRFPDAEEMLASEVRRNLEVARMDRLRISPVLGVHTGPGIVGIGAVPMELMQDLL